LPEESPKFSEKSSAGRRAVTKTPPKSRMKTTRYKVHKGDTLEKIARVYGVKTSDLAEQNQMKQDDTLQLGAVLVIPRES
jgi:LysM repeat protein